MPRILFVYYTVSQQTLRVVEAMTDTLRARGCDVQQARIEFTDLTTPIDFRISHSSILTSL